MNNLKHECPSCRATGIYKGSLEPSGIGVVCSLCQGLGHISTSSWNTPVFERRKRREDVNRVFLEISSRRGEYIGKAVSVEDFYKGVMPSKRK